MDLFIRCMHHCDDVPGLSRAPVARLKESAGQLGMRKTRWNKGSSYLSEDRSLTRPSTGHDVVLKGDGTNSGVHTEIWVCVQQSWFYASILQARLFHSHNTVLFTTNNKSKLTPYAISFLAHRTAALRPASLLPPNSILRGSRNSLVALHSLLSVDTPIEK